MNLVPFEITVEVKRNGKLTHRLDKGFKSIARELADAGVPMVIAHRSVVPDDDAITFVSILYGLLAEGVPLPCAINETRLRLWIDYAAYPDIFAQSVAYVQAPFGHVFDSALVNQNWEMDRKLQPRKQRLVAKTSHRITLTLSRFPICDWRITTCRTEHTLGEASHLHPLTLEPCCTSLLSQPVLQWAKPESVDKFEIELSRVESEGNYTSLWQGEVNDTNRLDLSDIGLALADSCMYNWELSPAR